VGRCRFHATDQQMRATRSYDIPALNCMQICQICRICKPSTEAVHCAAEALPCCSASLSSMLLNATHMVRLIASVAESCAEAECRADKAAAEALAV
jgi:hypothetical protein